MQPCCFEQSRRHAVTQVYRVEALACAFPNGNLKVGLYTPVSVQVSRSWTALLTQWLDQEFE